MKSPDPTFQEDLNSFLAFLKRDLKNHFRMEELLFFPAALNGDPTYATSLLVLNLQKEHGVLETRLKAIQVMEKRLKEKNRSGDALQKTGDFLEDIKKHAHQEVTELFPLMDENEKCVALLKEYAAKFKA